MIDSPTLEFTGVAAALTSRQDFTEASWHRAADLVLAACGTYPPALDDLAG